MYDFEPTTANPTYHSPEVTTNPLVVEDNSETAYKEFNLAWDVPRADVTFNLEHDFLSENLEDPRCIAKNAVQLLLLDNSLLQNGETRQILGLPADDEVFLRLVHEMLGRLIDYDHALSSHPIASLTRYPQEPNHQQLLAIATLTRWAINHLQNHFLFGTSYYHEDLEISSTFGACNATISPIVPFEVRISCRKKEPMVKPNEPERVLAILTQLVSTEHDLSLANQRKVTNVERAQAKVLKLETLSVETIFDLHIDVLDGIQDRTGRIRSGSICAGGVDRIHQPPPADEILDKLETFVKSANELSPTGNEYLDYERIARLAAEFQLIHPFEDGNGRVGHILTNVLLNKLHLPTSSVPIKFYKMYKKAMDMAVGKQSYYDLISLWIKFSDIPHTSDIP